MDEIKKDVVIIGAGYAGIGAALKLYENNIDFCIVEARNRIGGRVESHRLQNNKTIDLGAQWIGPTQYKMHELVKKYNIATFDMYNEGKNILHYKSKHSYYKGTIPKINPLALVNLGYAMHKFDRMSSKIDLEKPWSSPKAKNLDGQTLESWINKHVKFKKARYLFEVGINTVYACESSEISLLHALFYNKSGDDLDTLLGIENGAQQTLFVNGSQEILNKIVEQFTNDVHLNREVKAINKVDNTYDVVSNNLIVNAKHVIITVPPALIDRIKFNPLLPAKRAQLHQRMPMGTAMKCFAIYEHPFWRDKGLSGQVVSDDNPVSVVFDASPNDGSCGILLSFVESNNARNFTSLPESKRKQIVLNRLAKHFGANAEKPIQYIDRCWAEEEYSRGCYVGFCPPGVLTNFGDVLRKPIGNIHWAGTETAVKWNGYMDGAVESGYRAADEVIQKTNN